VVPVGVRFVESIDKTGVGKVDKKLLRAKHAQERGKKAFRMPKLSVAAFPGQFVRRSSAACDLVPRAACRPNFQGNRQGDMHA
jgi:hypothetical protein